MGGTTLTLTGAIGLASLLFTGLGWLDSVREGMRAMFGQGTLQGNFVMTKLRDVASLLTIGVLVLASTIAGLAINSVTGKVLDAVGLGGSTLASLALGALRTLVVFGVAVLVFLVLFWLLSGVSLPRSDTWDAALFGAIALGVLKQFGGVLLNGASHNKFLATAGVLLGLLVWLNLVSEVTLIAAAGGGSVESFPEDTTGRKVSSSFLHNGSVALFEQHGFSRVRPQTTSRAPSRA